MGSYCRPCWNKKRKEDEKSKEEEIEESDGSISGLEDAIDQMVSEGIMDEALETQEKKPFVKESFAPPPLDPKSLVLIKSAGHPTCPLYLTSKLNERCGNKVCFAKGKKLIFECGMCRVKLCFLCAQKKADVNEPIFKTIKFFLAHECDLSPGDPFDSICIFEALEKSGYPARCVRKEVADFDMWSCKKHGFHICEDCLERENPQKLLHYESALHSHPLVIDNIIKKCGGCRKIATGLDGRISQE